MITSNSTEITVRPASETDSHRIIDFQQRMAFETEGLRLDPPRVSAGVAVVFADPNKGRYYVAEHAGEIVGMLLTIPEWSDWRNGTVVWLHSVYVIAEYRRRGVFRRLFAHVKDEVIESPDLCGLRLYVEKRNATAQRVYERLGMTSDHYQMFEWLK